MKNLPEVTAFAIDKDIRNYQEKYYSKKETYDTGNISKKIKEIFSSKDHIYKSRVEITLKDSVVEETVIGRTSTELITLSGKRIKIIEILDIKKI